MPRKPTVYPIVNRKKYYLKCTNCTDLIVSLHRHDFRPCSCYENEIGNKGCAVDGGDDYFRILFSRESMPVQGYGLFEINYNNGTFKFLNEEVPNGNTKQDSTADVNNIP